MKNKRNLSPAVEKANTSVPFFVLLVSYAVQHFILATFVHVVTRLWFLFIPAISILFSQPIC